MTSTCPLHAIRPLHGGSTDIPCYHDAEQCDDAGDAAYGVEYPACCTDVVPAPPWGFNEVDDAFADDVFATDTAHAHHCMPRQLPT